MKMYFFVKISLSARRCGRCYVIAIILSLYVVLFPSALLVFVQSTNPRFNSSFPESQSADGCITSTNISFPVLQSADDFITFGKIRYNPDNLSFSMDPSGLNSTTRVSCVKLFYKNKVQMKNSRECSAVASFSTSFTFSMTLQEHTPNRSGFLPQQSGFLFIFLSENLSSLFGGTPDPSIKYFSIEFDTYNSYVDMDPSDNHIGVNVNTPFSAYTYNLCGGERTTCSFPWTGRLYTAWIDYISSTGSLEVWFSNGSLADGVEKPAELGLIEAPNLNLTDIFEDDMYVVFAGISGPFLDTYEVLSWNFASSHTGSEGMPTPTPKYLASWILDIVCAACGTAIVAATCLLGCYYWRRQPHMEKTEPGLGFDEDLLVGLRRFSFKELKKATKKFDESGLLGKGGSGFVFKGTLTTSGMAVAVKRLTPRDDSEHVEREFLAEVSSISQIRHKNLVHLQGWCHEHGHFLLVFDYMSNGSLDEWVFPNRRRYQHDPKYKKFEVLPWELRFSILAGIAAAVEYLHEEWVQAVLHRDIKSSNVLLDADFSPHLGDFGLARLMDHNKLEKTTLMAGTFGYVAPEMHYTGKATKESDVYSFGILILEVICGRRPINLQVEDPEESFLLLQSVWRAYETGHILSAVDPQLLNMYWHQATTFNVGDVVEGKIVRLRHLGLQCYLSDSQCRPSMRLVKQVIMQLQSSSTAEDAMTMLNFAMPVGCGSPLSKGEAGSFKPGSSDTSSSVLRLRLYNVL